MRRSSLDMTSCAGTRDRDSRHALIDEGSCLQPAGTIQGLGAKVDKLQQYLERSTLAHRNSWQRQEVVFRTMETNMQMLMAKMEQALKAQDKFPITFDKAHMKDIVKHTESEDPHHAQAAHVEHHPLERQLQAVKLDIERLGDKTSEMKQSFLEQQAKLDDTQSKISEHQARVDASYQAILGKLLDFKTFPLPPATMLESIGTSPFVTPRTPRSARKKQVSSGIPPLVDLPKIQEQQAQMDEGYAMLEQMQTLQTEETMVALDTRAAEPGFSSDMEEPPKSADASSAKPAKASESDAEAFQKAMGWTKSSRHSFHPTKSTVERYDVLTRIALSGPFSSMCAAMIVFNMIFMGIEGDIKVNNLLSRVLLDVDPFEPRDPLEVQIMLTVDWVFLAWMIIELFFNLWAAKVNGCEDWKWNLFDFVIMLTSAMQLVMSATNLSVMRVGKMYKLIKVMRVGKALKVLRVFRFLSGVRKMVLSVMGSLTSLFWAFLLMSLIIYVISIIFLQGIEGWLVDELVKVKESLQTTPAPSRRLFSFYQEEGEAQIHMIKKWYGGVPKTMLTLFRTISGGAEWAEVAEPVSEISTIYLGIWIIFIAFMIFGVLNVLTGVFCDAAMKAAGEDREMAMQEMMAEQESSANVLKKFFMEADADESGRVSREEFLEIIDLPDASGQLMQLGISSAEAKGLFDLLDDDGSNEVDIQEFVTGCLRLKGSAKSVDVVTLLFENKKVRRMLHNLNVNLFAIMGALHMQNKPDVVSKEQVLSANC